MLKNKLNKTILGISMVAVGIGAMAASAQSVQTMSTATSTEPHGLFHMNKHNKDNKGDRKDKHNRRVDHEKIEAAIIAGDYNTFKILASTSPLANISQLVFQNLQAPTINKKQSEDSIKSILTAAGITMPTKE